MTNAKCIACKKQIKEEYNYCPWCGMTQKWDYEAMTHIRFGANGK